MVDTITDLTGASAFISWKKDGDVSALQIHTMYKTFDPGFDASYENNTAGANKLETQQKIREVIAPKLKMAYRISADGQAVRAKMHQGARGELIWGPEGNAAGKPKWGWLLEVKKLNSPQDSGKLVEIEVEFVNVGVDYLFNATLGDTF